MTNKAVERQIQKIYKEVYEKVFNKAIVKKLTSAKNRTTAKELIKDLLESISDSKKYREFCRLFSAKLAKKGLNKERGVWRKYFEAAKSRHIVALPTTFPEYEKEMLAKVAKKNFKQIKSIPEKIFKVYEEKSVQTLLGEVIEGSKTVGSFERLLRKKGATNAKVIARTETAKLQASIREDRSKSLGSKAYIWIASNDRRTRPSHKAMNGVVVFWRPDDKKPLLDKMRGNAGEFPNCRCSSKTIFDSFDLPKAMYDVYDYRNDKIIKMTKIELLKALEKGEL